MTIKKFLSIVLACILFVSCATTSGVKTDTSKCIAVSKDYFTEEKLKEKGIDYRFDGEKGLYHFDPHAAGQLGIEYRCLSTSGKCIAIKKEYVSEATLKEKGIDYRFDEVKDVYYVDQIAAGQLGVEYRCVMEEKTDKYSTLKTVGGVIVIVVVLALLLALEVYDHKDDKCCKYY